MIRNPIGKITGICYIDISPKWQEKINRAEEYANNRYEEHKEKETNLYKSAHFEVWHNHFYDNIGKEEFEKLVRKEFIYIYTEKMVWKDIHKIRKNIYN